MRGGTARYAARGVLDFAVENPGAGIAAILLGGIALAAVLAPLIAPYNPFDLSSLDVLDAELPPWWREGSDPRFLLGTDAQGRDLLSAILYGTRISLTVGVLAVAIQAAIGIPLGLLAGYQRGQHRQLCQPRRRHPALALDTDDGDHRARSVPRRPRRRRA